MVDSTGISGGGVNHADTTPTDAALPTPDGTSGGGLYASLFKEVYRFDFHQVVRLLEAFTPGCALLGEGTDPTKEALYISSCVTFGFAANDLQSLNPANPLKPLKAHRPTLGVNFMGLAGVAKPLPTPYGHQIYQRIRHKDTAGADFLDIFNHRFTGLLYRIHKKFRVELSTSPLPEAVIGHCLSALSGFYVYTQAANNRLAISDASIMGFASSFWQHTHTAHNLKKMLCHYFHLPFTVHEFRGGWLHIPKSSASRLMYGYPTSYNTLGKDAVLGTRAWDQQEGITIALGPVGFHDYLTFLPGRSRFGPLRDLVRYYIDNRLTVEVTCLIRKETVPKCGLLSQPYSKVKGKEKEAEHPTDLPPTQSYLGYTSWLAAKSLANDATGSRLMLPRLES